MKTLVLQPDARFDNRDRDEAACLCAAIVLEAGPAVMEVYGRRCMVRWKADASPVSEADERAEAIIVAGLGRALPGLPVVAEEAASRGDVPAACDRFALVDPLDGTKEFLSRNGEFTLNVAIVDRTTPVVGAVYAPAIDRLWFGGAGAWLCELKVGASLPGPDACRPIHVRAAPRDGLTALASRSHCDEATETFLRRLPVRDRVSAGSSLKFCLIAEGRADVYPRFGPTMEWDTAAGEAVLRGAGGMVERLDHGPFAYGKAAAKYRNTGFVAWGDPAFARSVA